MATFAKKAKYTSEELRDARRNGWRKKKPKQPKRVTVQSAQTYLSRWNDWVRELKKNAKEYRTRANARRRGEKTPKQKARDAIKG